VFPPAPPLTYLSRVKLLTHSPPPPPPPPTPPSTRDRQNRRATRRLSVLFPFYSLTRSFLSVSLTRACARTHILFLSSRIYIYIYYVCVLYRSRNTQRYIVYWIAAVGNKIEYSPLAKNAKHESTLYAKGCVNRRHPGREIRKWEYSSAAGGEGSFSILRDEHRAFDFRPFDRKIGDFIRFLNRLENAR